MIEQAKGAVSVRCQVTAEVAFQMIRARARGQRRNMQEFCAEVIDNQGRMDGLPCNNGHVRLQL